jgi:hypothetical protein
MKPYDYAYRDGVREISWHEFVELADQLAEMLEGEHVHTVVGLARAGLFPAISVAMSLRKELYPARISRRFEDEVAFATPQWLVPISNDVEGKIVAIVDEIADTGETLSIAVAEAYARGASRVVTGTLVAHTWADPMPDYPVLVTDELVIFPWDREVLVDGEWMPHPEIEAALEAQGGRE